MIEDQAIDNYVYLNAGLSGALKQFRQDIKDAHDASTDQEVKDKLNNVYTGLQAIGSGMNLHFRHLLFGSTASSPTAPAAPEADSETIVTL
jgi:hypothetical protein